MNITQGSNQPQAGCLSRSHGYRYAQDNKEHTHNIRRPLHTHTHSRCWPARASLQSRRTTHLGRCSALRTKRESIDTAQHSRRCSRCHVWPDQHTWWRMNTGPMWVSETPLQHNRQQTLARCAVLWRDMCVWLPVTRQLQGQTALSCLPPQLQGLVQPGAHCYCLAACRYCCI
jgi:hypothetical protein